MATPATTKTKTKTKTQARSATTSSGRKSSAGKSGSKSAPDAIALLRADHKAVDDLLEQFEKARSAKRRADLSAQICHELTVHAQIEEEIFYPAFSAATKDKELVPEATVEHQTMKDLIAQIQAQTPQDDLFDAKVKVLGEYVKHHVKEEQNQIFPKARKSKMDLAKLGEQLRQRKEELTAVQ